MLVVNPLLGRETEIQGSTSYTSWCATETASSRPGRRKSTASKRFWKAPSPAGGGASGRPDPYRPMGHRHAAVPLGGQETHGRMVRLDGHLVHRALPSLSGFFADGRGPSLARTAAEAGFLRDGWRF